MGNPVWLYHNQHGASIFDSDEIPELEKQGWRDSPKKLEVIKEVTGGQTHPEEQAGEKHKRTGRVRRAS